MFDLPSGLPAAYADTREFLNGVRFARPGWLAFGLIPVAVAVVGWVARRRPSAGVVGRAGALAALETRPGQTYRFSRLALGLGWAALAAGAAGPRWGTAAGGGVAVGRDVVIVMDLSRSMWAEDMASAAAPARWRAAVAAARDVVSAARGDRFAVVVFAAKPKLLLPLTADLDHAGKVLAEIDARSPPPEVRPGEDSASGTRIGAALAAAVAAHDPRFPGNQDILLFTDADDPADDGEWRVGVTAARAAGIPVHVVGVGHPTQESFVRNGDAPLEGPTAGGATAPVQTRLHADVARAIAAEARGQYLGAETARPAAAEFVRTVAKSGAGRELADDQLPRPRDRSAAFLAAAAALFFAGWWREK